MIRRADPGRTRLLSELVRLRTRHRAPCRKPGRRDEFYVNAFKKTMEDPASIKQHKKTGLTMSFMGNKELGEPIKMQEAFCRDEISQLYK